MASVAGRFRVSVTGDNTTVPKCPSMGSETSFSAKPHAAVPPSDEPITANLLDSWGNAFCAAGIEYAISLACARPFKYSCTMKLPDASAPTPRPA